MLFGFLVLHFSALVHVLSYEHTKVIHYTPQNNSAIFGKLCSIVI